MQAEANAAAEAAAAAAQEQAAAAAALAAVPEPLPEGAEEDFFEKLQLKENGAPGAPEVLKPTANGSAGAAAGEGAAAAGEGEGAGAEEEEEEEAGSEGSGAWEDSVQRALVVGDYEAAVECCIAAGRAADALVLASVGGFSDLWTRTQAWYLKRNRKPYMKVCLQDSLLAWFSLVCQGIPYMQFMVCRAWPVGREALWICPWRCAYGIPCKAPLLRSGSTKAWSPVHSPKPRK